MIKRCVCGLKGAIYLFFLFIIIIYIKKATLTKKYTLFILCYVVKFVHLLENYDKLIKNDEPNRYEYYYEDIYIYVKYFLQYY